MADSGVQRLQLVYHGQVQGVFFRATTEQLARGRHVTGFVRNLPDGTVELQAQGAAGEIEVLLNDVYERYREQIERVERHELPLAADERGFRVER